MSAYSSVVLSELHLHPVPASLTSSRRAAQRYELLEAAGETNHQHRPLRPSLARRLLTLGRRPQRTTA